MHLDTIAINLTNRFRGWVGGMIERDWKKSDTLASRLPDLQKVVLGFESRKGLLGFVDNVVNTQMKNLRDAGKLRYAVIDETGRWMRADKLERTYEYLSQFISGI